MVLSGVSESKLWYFFCKQKKIQILQPCGGTLGNKRRYNNEYENILETLAWSFFVGAESRKCSGFKFSTEQDLIY